MLDFPFSVCASSGRCASRSNHSGKGSSGSLPSSSGACAGGSAAGGGASGVGNGVPNPDDAASNGEYFNNNHSGGDNSVGSEVCDVPYEVANQKRHVSNIDMHPGLCRFVHNIAVHWTNCFHTVARGQWTHVHSPHTCMLKRLSISGKLKCIWQACNTFVC